MDERIVNDNITVLNVSASLNTLLINDITIPRLSMQHEVKK